MISTPEEANSLLISTFSEEEVKEVIFNSSGDKSPGPDGFNFRFFQVCWEIIKSDIMAFLNEFHINGRLPRSLNSSFLALIPKQTNPTSLNDFRPISLIGSLYKILSKILSNRIKGPLNSIISKCQSAFLPGRQILDGVLVVNEVMDFALRAKKECLVMKIDFEKAFDTVSWAYLERMMGKLGFCSVWINWIKSCVFSSSVSVLVNGSPTDEFSISRGLRQGDPLSPFLFLIAAEGLTSMINKAISLDLLKGFQVSTDLSYPILQFADDTILLCEKSWENVWVIKSIFQCFELISGLKVNFIKSKIMGLNINRRFLESASNFLACSIGSIPFKFLGCPVGANPRRSSTWKPIIVSLKSKLATWKNRNISMGGVE